LGRGGGADWGRYSRGGRGGWHGSIGRRAWGYGGCAGDVVMRAGGVVMRGCCAGGVVMRGCCAGGVVMRGCCAGSGGVTSACRARLS
jgi:hypothetical protein